MDIDFSDKKIVAESLCKFDISQIRKERLLKNGTSANITFRDGDAFEIKPYISKSFNDSFINFIYLNEINPIVSRDFRVELDTTWCRFGGYRYWFLCPNCRERIRVLYKNGSEFGCRHCLNLTYQSRVEGKTRRHSVTRYYNIRNKAENLRSQIKRLIYAGRPTKKVQQLDYLVRKCNALEITATKIIDKMKTRQQMLERQNRCF